MASSDLPHISPTTMIPLPSRERFAHPGPVNLPRPLTLFVGRSSEIQTILARIRMPGVRLLNLIGPGGVGKTRLAIAVAGQMSEDFPDGIRFVPLVAVEDPAHVLSMITGTLGIRESGRSVAGDLAQFVGGRRMLIVLDNLEQVISSASSLAHLLGRCPNLVILATSRVRMQVSGENEYLVRSMHLPDLATPLVAGEIASFDGVALFIDRMRAIEPEFVVSDVQARTIVEICHQLEGLPLGIELAAARTSILSLADVLTRLRNPLDFLTGGAVDHPPHQRTMRDTVAWSYELLSPVEQQIFRRLSIFSGGFTVEAASIVATVSSLDVLEDLSSLVDKSLIRKMGNDVQAARLTMLAVIREYGFEQLKLVGELILVSEGHASFFLAFAEEADRHLVGPDASTWLNRLDAERANLRTACGWFAGAGDGGRFIRLITCLQKFWITRGHYSEGRQWFARAIEVASMPDADPRWRFEALRGEAWIALRQGDGASASRDSAASLALARELGDRRQLARALELASAVARRVADDTLALEFLREALECSQAEQDLAGIAQALHQIATVTMNLGRLQDARDLFPAVIAAYEETGDAHGGAIARDSESIVLYCLGDFVAADESARMAVRVLRAVGDKRALAVALGHVAKCAQERGDLERAWLAHEECLPMRRDIGDLRGLAVWLEGIAMLLAKCDQPEAAAMVLGATGAARDQEGAPYYGNELIDHQRTVALIRARVHEDRYESAVRTGRAKMIDAVIDHVVRIVPDVLATATATSTAVLTSEAEAFSFPSAWGLTPREADVLRLIAARHSDREIADALFISRYTVARHVAALLRKLDVRSRHEAARLALEHASDHN